MIFTSISHPVWWTGSAKGNHFSPVNTSVCTCFGVACETSISLNSSILAAHFPLGGAFLICKPHLTDGRHTTGVLLYPHQTLRCHQDRQKSPMVFSDAPRATCVIHFLYVVSRSCNQNLTFFPFTSNTVRDSCGLAPNSSLLQDRECLCPTIPILSFSTGTDLSCVEGRALCRFSEVLISARCTQISRQTTSLCGSSAMYVLPGSNSFRENPLSLASRLFKSRRFFAAASNRLVHANGVRPQRLEHLFIQLADVVIPIRYWRGVPIWDPHIL